MISWLRHDETKLGRDILNDIRYTIIKAEIYWQYCDVTEKYSETLNESAIYKTLQRYSDRSQEVT